MDETIAWKAAAKHKDQNARSSPWLSFREVCERLEVSERLARKTLKELLPGAKIGRLWRVHEDDLERVLRERAYEERSA